MADLQEHSVVVFVLDADGHAIPGAKISISVEGTEIAQATTKGFTNAPIRLHLPPNISTLTIKATVGRAKQTQTVDVGAGTCTFTFPKVRRAPVQPAASEIPKWMPVVGVLFSAITLLFFMALVLIAVFTGNTPPPQAKYLVVITLSFCAAFSTLGLASIAASGHLPGEIGKEQPIQFTAIGSIAAFIVVFVLGNLFYPDASKGAEPSGDVQFPGASGQVKPAAPQAQTDESETRLIIAPDVLTQMAGDAGLSSQSDISYRFYIDSNPTVLDAPFEVFTTRALSPGPHSLEVESSKGGRVTCIVNISKDVREYLITGVPPNGCKAAAVSK